MNGSKDSILNGIADNSLERFFTPLTSDEADSLVEACKTDVGAPFESTMLSRLAATKRDKLPDFHRLRSRLKETKISVTGLDLAVAERSDISSDMKAGVEDNRGQGGAIAFPEIEPADEPVDGATLLQEISEQVCRHVSISKENAIAVVLWIVAAYCYDLFNHSARLFITSPERRCGKTTLLRVIQALVPRPLAAANITPAAMFRTIEKHRPTLLIDEADTFLRDNEELRGIINSGHERYGSVIRLVGEDYEPRAFSTFCPTAIAAIGSVPSTIEDRSFIVSLRRRLPTENVEKFRGGRAEELHATRRKISRWVADHKHSLRNADPAMPEALHDRACDNWHGAMAIADVVGGLWGELARAAALSLMQDGETRDNPSQGVLLLADVSRIFDNRLSKGERDRDRISSTDLQTALHVLDSSPWATWARGKPISTAGIKKILQQFKIVPNTIRLADGRQPNGYKLSQFEDAFERYLPKAPVPATAGSPPSPMPTNSGIFRGTGHSPEGTCGEGPKSDQSQQMSQSGEPGELQIAEFALVKAPCRSIEKGEEVDDGEDWRSFFNPGIENPTSKISTPERAQNVKQVEGPTARAGKFPARFNPFIKPE